MGFLGMILNRQERGRQTRFSVSQNANGDVAVYKGENVTGLSSAASGPILQIFDKNNVELVPSASGSLVN